jgi:hypothetical protein
MPLLEGIRLLLLVEVGLLLPELQALIILWLAVAVVALQARVVVVEEQERLGLELYRLRPEQLILLLLAQVAQVDQTA